MNVELGNLWDIVDKGGTVALALLIIVAFLRGWIVPRWAYLELKDRCNQLSTLAERATELADRQAIAGEELRRRLKDMERFDLALTGKKRLVETEKRLKDGQ